MDELPSSPALPNPLPKAPPVPISHLGKLRARIDNSEEMKREEQSSILVQLKAELNNPELRDDAYDLLQSLRRRPDLLAQVSEEINLALASARPSRPPRAASTGSNQPTSSAGTASTAAPSPNLGRRIGAIACMGFGGMMTFASVVDAGVGGFEPIGVIIGVGLVAVGRWLWPKSTSKDG